MTGSFDIAVDPDRHLVRIRLSGFFDADTLARFLDARHLATGHLRCGPNEHVSLVDISAMSIQTQDVVAAFGTVFADPSIRSRRLAFVVAPSLARMQLNRALGGRINDGVRFFADQAAAERWVLTHEELPTAAVHRAPVPRRLNVA